MAETIAVPPKTPRTREDIAWAAGLFEGEGSFGTVTPSAPRKSVRFVAQMGMTDRDVVERFVAIIGLGRLQGPYLRDKDGAKGWKPIWRWRVSRYEETQAVVAMLWPWLCERRRGQARRVMLMAKAGRLPTIPANAQHCRRGHLWTPEIECWRDGKRTCRTCLRANWRKHGPAKRARAKARKQAAAGR